MITALAWFRQDLRLMCIPHTSTMGDRVLIKYGDLIQKQAPHLKWIACLSSTGVYGNHEGNWVNENSECTPHTPTGIAPLKSEAILFSFAQSFIPFRKNGKSLG